MLAAAFLMIACVFLSGCGSADRDWPLGDRIANAGEIVGRIRQGLKGHAASMTITFDYGSNIYDELNQVISAWVEAALQETGKSDEGDYIRQQYGGYTYNSRCTMEDGRWHYTVTIVPEYYCYLTQEEEAGHAMTELLRSFGFNRKTDAYEKVKTIYGWLCNNVSYDKVHRKHKYYHLCSTAYAAVVRHQATCQGYCTALYRMLRESGIDCRIIVGTAVPEPDDGVPEAPGGDGLHAWMIASVDGQWYYLDPTWDAGQETWRYFLVGSSHFTGHVSADQYRTESFRAQYPMAGEDYERREM